MTDSIRMYCLHCKKNIDTLISEINKEKRLLKGICSECKGNTAQFVSQDTILKSTIHKKEDDKKEKKGTKKEKKDTKKEKPKVKK